MNKEQDFSKKAVIVLDRELESWQVLNAATHIAAYIGHQLGDEFDTGEFFETQDGATYPRNSQFAIILLRAKKTQLPNLMAKARDSGLLYHGFIKEMIETTNDNEIAETLAGKTAADIELLGVGVFGSIDEVNALTKNFQMWR